MNSIIFVLAVRAGFLTSSPVVIPTKDGGIIVDDTPVLLGSCVLPAVYGLNGRTTFIEDCDTLDQLPILPFPEHPTVKYGVHPQVCCPEKQHKSSICFPTDEWCPSYKPPVFDYTDIGEDLEGDYVDDYAVSGDYVDDRGAGADYVYYGTEEPATISENICEGEYQGWTCANFRECGIVVELNGTAVKAGICGYDTKNNLIKICCPPSYLTAKENSESSLVPPQYPGYDCLDKHTLCKRWKNNGACKLDIHFNINKDDPDDPQGIVDSAQMFDLMMGICMETCGWCGDKGCRDEDPRCPQWARDGQCVVNPYFMVHSCRESCGVCGLLSPLNTEIQKVNGKSYSNFSHSDFDCGRVELLSVINGDDRFLEEKAEISDTITEEDEDDIDLRTDGDVFFSIDRDDKNAGDIFCGATRITDRWVVTAAHCHDVFKTLAEDVQRELKTLGFRDKTKYKESIEMKRVIKHPKYVFPNLYNDIALIELGRRLIENFPKYGDTPTCLDHGKENILGKTATVQGYGKTFSGSSGKLLEANLTIISNDRCQEILDYNVTRNELAKGRLNKGLPRGINNQLICGQGKLENGIFKGSCKGDSGGPLLIENNKKLKSLTGIVSGGLGCGEGSPGWYTKISFFYPWIKCVIEKSVQFNNVQKLIHDACTDEAFEGDGPEEDDPIFGNVFDPIFDNDIDYLK